MTAKDALEVQAATLFVTAPNGRMVRSNDPDGSPAPRMHLAIGGGGAVLRLRDDIDSAVADKIAALAAQEPPVREPDAMPRFAEDYRVLLGVAASLTAHDFGVTYRLPHLSPQTPGVRLVAHGTAAGDELVARIATLGMPRTLQDVGFADLSHFWAPWCVALDGEEIASIAFAARLGARGAEIGVTTMTPFRGRGFAAAATAGWSALPALQDRPLFYGTHRDNLSSQRVIARLGLPFLGVRMQL
ncbi:MAG TPA: GNAT family N-acetyltransferase [Rhizomicrobium sp.]|jgi:hypothetical protein|nr:GNAT family N-acetyltransferase [Rhizomicrobium sp.]